MDGQYIPNRDVWFGNNVIANPAGQPSRWQQVTVAEDVTPPPGSNVPNPARADDGLVIRDVWLLRMRALLAQSRGNDVAYRDLVGRYRAMAESLGFEGHIAWATEMLG